MTLSGTDAGPRDPEFVLEPDDLLRDTAAHTSVIVEDLLLAKFRACLNSHQNDPYRPESRIRKHLECFGNSIDRSTASDSG